MGIELLCVPTEQGEAVFSIKELTECFCAVGGLAPSIPKGLQCLNHETRRGYHDEATLLRIVREWLDVTLLEPPTNELRNSIAVLGLLHREILAHSRLGVVAQQRVVL